MAFAADTSLFLVILSIIYTRLVVMHARIHENPCTQHDNIGYRAREPRAHDYCWGGWIMIIVETQLHSGNLESSQRNLEECAPYPK